MNEQEVREFEENIVKGANIAFQRLVNQKKKEDGELVFSRNGHIFSTYHDRNAQTSFLHFSGHMNHFFKRMFALITCS